MIKLNVGTKLGFSFGLALLILVIIGTVAYQSIQKLIYTAGLVTQTHEVLSTLESVLSTIKDAETGQRGYLLVGEDRYLEPYNAAQKAIDQELKDLREMTKNNPRQVALLNDLERLVRGKEGKFAELDETITVRKDPAKGAEAALAIVRTDRGKQVMDDIRKTMADMKAEAEARLKERTTEADENARTASLTIILGTTGAFVLLAIIAYLITGNIANPLKVISANADRIAGGDLSVSLPATDRADEVGVLSNTFARMQDSLRGMAGAAGRIADGDLRAKVQPQSDKDLLGTAFSSMIGNLQRLTTDLTEGVNVLSTAANEISSSTTQLASSATESATAVSETTTTVEEVRQTAQMASQKAKNVSEAAQKAVQISQSGRKSTEDMSAGMQRIRKQMDDIAASMGRLSEQGSAIGLIIATVEDLAGQSNLLAVNAAIEAAKAGEHGKGFSVVAQEVKSLAEQSRQATNQVRNILSDIQKATTSAVLATEQGSKAVEAGIRQTETAADSIQSLTGSVGEVGSPGTELEFAL